MFTMLAAVGVVAAQLVDFEVMLAPDQIPHVITARVRDDWAPKGAQRLVQLVDAGHFDNCAFFRVIRGFVSQFGISGNTTQQALWRPRPIRDEDRVVGTNARGTITFAHAGPNTRSTQLFINLGNNKRLDKENFPPVAEIVDGLQWIDQIHVTGEGGPQGPGPNQGQLQRNGDTYLQANFPMLSRIRTAKVRRDEPSLYREPSRPRAAPRETSSIWLLGVLFFGVSIALWVYLSTTQRVVCQQAPTLLDVEASLSTAVAPNKES